MNQVKYKAWHKREKVMVTVDGLPYDYDIGELRVQHENDHINGLVGGSLSNYELRRYTDLKDKNGVEIYSEDFLRCEDSNSDYPIYALVEWDDEYGRWKATTKDGEEYCEYELWELLLEFTYIDVEGNKYENNAWA